MPATDDMIAQLAASTSEAVETIVHEKLGRVAPVERDPLRPRSHARVEPIVTRN